MSEPGTSRSSSPTEIGDVPQPQPREQEENHENTAPKQDVPQQVKEDLKEYLDLQEQIKGANLELKVFKERLKELSADIAEYMAQHGIQFFNTPQGKVSFYQSKSMKPLNKDFLKEAMESKISDKALVNELTTIFEKRPFTEVNRIKVFPKRKDQR